MPSTAPTPAPCTRKRYDRFDAAWDAALRISRATGIKPRRLVHRCQRCPGYHHMDRLLEECQWRPDGD